MAESEEQLNSLLRKVKEESEKAGLKLNTQKATVRTRQKTMDWFKTGQRVRQGCILSLCLFSLYEEYILRNVGLEEAQDEIKMPGEISVISDTQVTPPLRQKAQVNERAS